MKKMMIMIVIVGRRHILNTLKFTIHVITIMTTMTTVATVVVVVVVS
jgi:hypothetical protein